MHGLYISNIDITSETDGVAKKILMQIDAFRKNGINVEYCRTRNAYNSTFRQKVLSRFPFFAIAENWFDVNIDNIDVLYIRKAHFDREFWRFLKKAKNKGVKKILLEIPTYPYDLELKKRWQVRPYLWKDKFYRKKLSKYIDRVTTYSQDDEIFGIPTIKIVNGMDFSNISKRQIKSSNSNELHLLCVANMSFWHGYDRLLYGLSEYYKDLLENSVKVYAHFVGEGPELDKYRKIVNQTGISEYVIFYGSLSGTKLDEIYDKCNVGICSLGCHRKNIFLTSELKTREYSAKGLPMVSSCIIDVFPEKEYDFIKMLPAVESPIKIDEIIEWYRFLIQRHGSEEDLIKDVVTSGKEKCDIFVTMQPVINYIKNE